MILIVLNIIPIVNWIVIGYAARVLRESPSTETPPKLEKYGEMFVDGAKVTFASLIYMLVPTILIATVHPRYLRACCLCRVDSPPRV